jgi:hypothetical protein
MTQAQDDRINRQLTLVKQAALGQCENLECPDCRHPSVSVCLHIHSRTNTGRGLFVLIANFIHNSARPDHFTEDRVNSELERMDESILKAAIFKRPK